MICILEPKYERRRLAEEGLRLAQTTRPGIVPDRRRKFHVTKSSFVGVIVSDSELLLLIAFCFDLVSSLQLRSQLESRWSRGPKARGSLLRLALHFLSSSPLRPRVTDTCLISNLADGSSILVAVSKKPATFDLYYLVVISTTVLRKHMHWFTAVWPCFRCLWLGIVAS